MSAVRGIQELALDALEDTERVALSWGVASAAISREELEDTIDGVIDATEEPVNRDEVIRTLLDQGLIFETDSGDRPGYRTRSAETIRLLSGLRQLFQNHMGHGRWRSAPPLVHDYRFVTRTRRFPRRDVPASVAADEIVRDLPVRPESVAAVRALLRADGDNGRDLARFQVEASRHVLGAVIRANGGATIVGAGTGSGKTLAFYLPALAIVAADMDGDWWTKVVAVYPRIELLRDQLSSAVREARILDGVARRAVRLGAMFGSTPHNARVVDQFRWPKVGRDAHECPLLRCPNEDCRGPLLWHRSDRERRVERLQCRDCSLVLEDGTLGLTRESMARMPPDILFTTTETVHRQLASPSHRHVFGARPNRKNPPKVLLLDEAHTYSGLSGAQTALLLRRWRHAVGAKLHVVALSATLADPKGFVAQLASMPEESVSAITPSETDLDDRGREYLLAVRGNPMSGSALLSTTVQALILMRRMLNVSPKMGEPQLFGSRVFAFTDDLDVTNRLLRILRDAEARWPSGRPRGSWTNRRGETVESQPLAALRSPHAGYGEEHDRRADGQIWDAPVRLGHTLSAPGLEVTRTSSQDAGVDPRSDIVVATASLEVGFDDDRAGCVLQHKAPRDPAGFIQRKGRAGRLLEMRPWTIVVLSDYGRDRVAYQGYDLLLDPELRPQPLPVGNLHVLRMQATASTLDWLAWRLASDGSKNGDLWSELALRWSEQTKRDDINTAIRGTQHEVRDMLMRVLEDPREQVRLESHLRGALRLDDRQLRAVMWESPRPVLAAAIPALMRRLEDQWSDSGEEPVRRNPLPDYLAENLFSDLNVPEVEIEVPSAPADEQSNVLSLIGAMRELTPGRVTKRFAVKDVGARHWIPIVSGASRVDITEHINSLADLGVVRFEGPSGIEERRLFRPLKARLQDVPDDVRDSQDASLEWRTVFSPVGEPEVLAFAPQSSASDLLSSIEVFSHAAGAEVEATRLAFRSTADDLGNTRHSVAVDFVDGSGAPAAIGYSASFDAIRASIVVPPDLLTRIDQHPGLVRSLRRERFVRGVTMSPQLDGVAGYFARGWLAELYLAALGATATASGVDGQRAANLISDAGIALCCEKALDAIFELGRSVEGDDHDDSRAIREIRELLRTEEVDAAMRQAGGRISSPLDADDLPWIVEMLTATAGAALREALQRLCPRVDVDSLVLDVDAQPGRLLTGKAELWLCESSVGGAGVIDEVARAARDESLRLVDLMHATLGPTEFERSHDELITILDMVATDPRMAERADRVRQATSARDAREGIGDLVLALRRHGLVVPRSTMTTLATRILRPGSSAATVVLADLCMRRWDDVEQLAGVEVDPRAVAYVLADDVEVERSISGLGGLSGNRTWRYSQVYSLLWPRGKAARAASLDTYSPFVEFPRPERLLAQAVLGDPPPPVDLAVDWRQVADALLCRHGECVLVGSPEAARRALHDFALVPVDLGYLHLHPRVTGVHHAESGQVRLNLLLGEGSA